MLVAVTTPFLRRRLVGQEFNTSADATLYAATPPLELLRLIVSICASNRGFKIMTNDVSRAYFYAPMAEGDEVYVRLPSEDSSEGMCGKLNYSMYGTRKAAEG